MKVSRQNAMLHNFVLAYGRDTTMKFMRLMEETKAPGFEGLLLSIRKNCIHDYLRMYGETWKNDEAYISSSTHKFQFYVDQKQLPPSEHYALGYLIIHAHDTGGIIFTDAETAEISICKQLTTDHPELTILLENLETRHRFLIENGETRLI